jgi:hypothetical protein
MEKYYRKISYEILLSIHACGINDFTLYFYKGAIEIDRGCLIRLFIEKNVVLLLQYFTKFYYLIYAIWLLW